jgi:hypothetical protein
MSRFYNDLFFRVFNITQIENKVNVKYKTKNNNTDVKDVFLATINQRTAIANSSRNLRLTEIRLCSV